MDKLKFIQAITRLRVLETRLLDRIKLDRMIDSATADQAIKVLVDSNYGGQANLQRPEDYELLLKEELNKLYNLMYEISPEKILIDLMVVRYDYHNIKVLLKAKALKKELDYLLTAVVTVPIATLKESIISENYKQLPPLMMEAIEKVEENFSKSQDPQEIDMILDKYLYKDMVEKGVSLSDPYVIEYLKIMIDFINIKTFIRIKKQNKDRRFLEEVLIPGGKIEEGLFYTLLNEPIENLGIKLSYTDYQGILKEGLEEYAKTKKINLLEKEMDNFLMNYIKRGKYVSFGVEPLFSYMFAKETEIKNVRIIMVGKMNNITSAVIRERLRDIYV